MPWPPRKTAPPALITPLPSALPPTQTGAGSGQATADPQSSPCQEPQAVSFGTGSTGETALCPTHRRECHQVPLQTFPQGPVRPRPRPLALPVLKTELPALCATGRCRCRCKARCAASAPLPQACLWRKSSGHCPCLDSHSTCRAWHLERDQPPDRVLGRQALFSPPTPPLPSRSFPQGQQ